MIVSKTLSGLAKEGVVADAYLSIVTPRLTCVTLKHRPAVIEINPSGREVGEVSSNCAWASCTIPVVCFSHRYGERPMKALKTLALVSLSTLGLAAVQADEPVQTQPQTVIHGQYVESSHTPRLFGRKHRSEVVQTSGTMQQTTSSTTVQSTPSTTATTSTTTPVVQSTTGTQRRGLLGKLRSRRSSNMTTTSSSVTSSTTTTGSDAKPMPLGK